MNPLLKSLALAVVVTLVGSGTSSFAQAPAGAPAADRMLNIKKIDAGKVKTPDYVVKPALPTQRTRACGGSGQAADARPFRIHPLQG